MDGKSNWIVFHVNNFFYSISKSLIIILWISFVDAGIVKFLLFFKKTFLEILIQFRTVKEVFTGTAYTDIALA